VVFTTAKGIVSYKDMLDHVLAKRAAEALTLPEIIDARDVALDLSISELGSFAAEVRKARKGEKPGKIAVVTNSAFLFALARSYAKVRDHANPRLQVFCDFEEAHAWLIKPSSTTDE